MLIEFIEFFGFTLAAVIGCLSWYTGYLMDKDDDKDCAGYPGFVRQCNNALLLISVIIGTVLATRFTILRLNQAKWNSNMSVGSTEKIVMVCVLLLLFGTIATLSTIIDVHTPKGCEIKKYSTSIMSISIPAFLIVLIPSITVIYRSSQKRFGRTSAEKNRDKMNDKVNATIKYKVNKEVAALNKSNKAKAATLAKVNADSKLVYKAKAAKENAEFKNAYHEHAMKNYISALNLKGKTPIETPKQKGKDVNYRDFIRSRYNRKSMKTPEQGGGGETKGDDGETKGETPTVSFG